jgi:hypothetical protein
MVIQCLNYCTAKRIAACGRENKCSGHMILLTLCFFLLPFLLYKRLCCFKSDLDSSRYQLLY